ncbi:DUF1566 domain-containing protein [Pseudoalteromonas mariniglutinosa]|uniref:Lcl C-terminal domain-containing protein n=1 Tax=Pseudoalteromonas mariniglutinosa TaxID=206042 RepID=UPI00384AFA7F
MKKQLLCAALTLLLSTATWAQVCYELPSTTPTTRFTINDNGTVSDSKTGLMWQRCSFGQTYNLDIDGCEGNVQQLTWQEALRGAENSEMAGFDDWHVPNIKELATILEHSCVQPSINEAVFLATRDANYWSSTSGVSRADLAWVYQFDKGLNSLHAKTSDVYLRLVRYEQ